MSVSEFLSDELIELEGKYERLEQENKQLIETGHKANKELRNEVARLEGQVVELVKALQSLVGSATVNEEQLNDLLKCGDYGESEALCKGRQLLNKLGAQDDRALLEDIAKLNKLGAHRDK